MATSVLQGYVKKRPATQAKMMIERDVELKRQAKHAGKPLWKKTIDEARDINKHEAYMNKLQEKQEKMFEPQQQKEQLFELTNRAGYGDDPLDIEHFLRNSRKAAIEKTAAMKIQKVARKSMAKNKQVKIYN